VRKDPGAKENRQPLEAAQGKETDSPLEPPKVTSSAATLTLDSRL